jgi:hypothetical protein
MGLSVDINVSVITEDFIDAVCASHEFQGNSPVGVADGASGSPSKGLPRSGANDSHTVADQPPDQPALRKSGCNYLDVGLRSNWTFNTQAWAFRRVLMNLLDTEISDAWWVKISINPKTSSR